MLLAKLNFSSEYNILVTGGAGFIGSNLCEAFLKNGNKVICLDNFSTGKYENIKPFLRNENFTFIEGDIRELDNCETACENVDYILHQAALGSVPRSINDPILSNEVNVSGFLNMLVAARNAKIKRFIYAASSSTYGDSEVLPKVEEQIGVPLSPYAVTKYVNELYANVFSKTYGIETIGLRYFNVFGKRQDPDSAYAAVIPKFTTQLINHKSPTINGDGSFSRDFTYIDNVVEMNVRALLADNQEALNTVYNVAYGERTSLNELIELLKQYLNPYDSKITNIEVNFGPERLGDVPHSLASIDKARKNLGYRPQYDIKSGLKSAMDWYWNNLK